MDLEKDFLKIKDFQPFTLVALENALKAHGGAMPKTKNRPSLIRACEELQAKLKTKSPTVVSTTTSKSTGREKSPTRLSSTRGKDEIPQEEPKDIQQLKTSSREIHKIRTREKSPGRIEATNKIEQSGYTKERNFPQTEILDSAYVPTSSISKPLNFDDTSQRTFYLLSKQTEYITPNAENNNRLNTFL